MIRRMLTLLFGILLTPLTATVAAAESSCPWKLNAYGENMDMAELGIGRLTGEVVEANRSIQASRTDMIALLVSDCDPAMKEEADAIGAKIAAAIAEHTHLAETTQQFAPCDQFMSDKVKRESAAAVEAGNSNLVLKLSGIDRAIRDLSVRGFAVDHEMNFLRSKLDRIEGERVQLYAACVGGVGDVDF